MKPRLMGSSKLPSVETKVHSITFRIAAAPSGPAGQAPARVVTVTGGRSGRGRKPGGLGPPSLRPARGLYRWEPCDVPKGPCDVTADLLTLARAGDEEAVRHLIEPYRHHLQLHCYRILGS